MAVLSGKRIRVPVDLAFNGGFMGVPKVTCAVEYLNYPSSLFWYRIWFVSCRLRANFYIMEGGWEMQYL